jgi:hypothetical protein
MVTYVYNTTYFYCKEAIAELVEEVVDDVQSI